MQKIKINMIIKLNLTNEYLGGTYQNLAISYIREENPKAASRERIASNREVPRVTNSVTQMMSVF